MESSRRALFRRLVTLGVAAVLVAGIGLLVVQYYLDQQSITWRENARVHDGMTLSEIEAVLGAPRSIESLPDGATRVRWMGRKQGMVMVDFDAHGSMRQRHFVYDAIDYTLSFYPRAIE
jgi:hypothetical protein